jgi:hypothetical protein
VQHPTLFGTSSGCLSLIGLRPIYSAHTSEIVNGRNRINGPVFFLAKQQEKESDERSESDEKRKPALPM